MKLIIINGPCGIGKSTLAKNLHETMSLSYLIGVDDITRGLSGYRQHRPEARKVRERLTYATLETMFELGHDVILEKMNYQEEILDEYRNIAQKHGVKTFEIILWAPKEVVMKRAHERGWREGGLLTPEKCEQFWDQVDEVKDNRKDAVVLDVSEMDEKQVLNEVQKIMG
jgi:predicted kinase